MTIRLCARMVLPHAPVPTASTAASPAACVCICIARPAPSPDAPQHTRRGRSHRLTARVPHPYRADRPIKKKPRGRRNPPANEAVTKWLIIEALESATLEEIVQFAFCVCDA